MVVSAAVTPRWRRAGRAGADQSGRACPPAGIAVEQQEEVVVRLTQVQAEPVQERLTSAEIDRDYVDTHGASVVGFAFADLVGFGLLPRLKNIGSARLYRPDDQSAPPGLRRC
jgi:Tn3 transposase DDE domain